MTARVNSAEGGTNGATVTTANSGGTSGNAWDAVSIPSGTTVTFAAAAAYKGTLGYRITPGTATGTGPSLRRSLVGWTRFRDRWYLRVSALPTVATQVAYVTNSGDSKVLARLILLPTGRLGVQDAYGNTVFTASASISTATWYRIEWLVVPGTRTWNGTLRFAYAAGDGAAIESYASTSANTGTDGTLGTLFIGKLAGTWSANLDLDDFATDDQSSTTFLGASAASGTPVVVDPSPPPGAPVPSWPPPAPYTDAVRGSGISFTYSVSATYGGSPVAGATGLTPTGGSITDTNKAGVRRVLSVDLPGGPALFALLAPTGTLLTVTAIGEYIDRTTVTIPMGVFDIDSEKLSESSGIVSITAPDQWVQIQRAKFLTPRASSPGSTVVAQAAALISEVTGDPVQIDATSTALMGAQVWEKDREDAILKMLTDIGAWVSFDRHGTCIIADIPTAGNETTWLVDASTSGVLIDLDRERSRTETRNVVIVTSSATDGELFTPQVAWDNDPTSPTYAGPDPLNSPQLAGPFGLSVDYLDTPLPLDNLGAQAAGGALLQRQKGLASQVSLSLVPNPAIDSFDVVTILPPTPDRNTPRSLETHIVDTVTHPISTETATTIDGRQVGT